MKRWSKYVKPYTAYFILGPLCMIVEIVGEILMPALLAKIIDVGIANGDWGYVALMSALMVVFAVVMMLGGIGGAWFGAKASGNFATDLRLDVYKKIQDFSFTNIDKFSTSSLITRLTNDVTQLQNFINMLLRMCLRSPGILIGALIMAIIIAPKLATVLFFAIPLIVAIQGVIISKAFSRFSKMQEKIDGLNSSVGENIANVRVVKSFNREEYEKEKFAKANKNLKDAGVGAMKLMILSSPLMTLVMNLASVAVLFIGGKTVIDNPFSLSIGSLSAFVTYLSQILMSLTMLSMLFVFASRAIASGKRICEVLDEKTDIESGTSEMTVQHGSIEFENVSFRYYKDSPEPVLDNVSFKVEAGSTVGIIGTTGSGKSTLVSMIPRLYDPSSGRVLVDGVDVREYDLKNLRRGVSMVLQNNVLFSGTVAQNLRFGDEDATDEELVWASEAAQADKFVKGFDGGYNAPVTRGGTNVSGGQKQRLCIARALIAKPKILILDDSTSAVDTATEASIRKSLRELTGTTKIIIAQRVSSVVNADVIIVMTGGKITGMGTHEDLLASNGEYKEIYESQISKEEE
mgnify:CR=1 FL=1